MFAYALLLIPAGVPRASGSLMKMFKRFCLLVAPTLALIFLYILPSFAQLDEAAALNQRVIELRQYGKYADAIPLMEQVLAIYEKVLGPDDPDVAAALHDLGRLYCDRGRYAEAEPLYKRSLVIQEKALGPDDLNLAHLLKLAVSLSDLAMLYNAQGRYAEAEPLHKRSLAVWEKALGPDDLGFAKLLNNLANLYYDQGRYAEAEPLAKQSLSIKEKVLNPDDPDLTPSLGILGLLLKLQGRYAEAEPLYLRSLSIQEKATGPGHPDVATFLHYLAELYTDEGRYAEAEPLEKRALVIREKAFGIDNPDIFTASSLNTLAKLHYNQGRYADAELLFKRALVLLEKASGTEHPTVATALNNLAVLYATNGRYAEAEPLYKRALEIQEKALGPSHPAVAESLNNLANAYYNVGRYADALRVLRQNIHKGVARKGVAFAVLFQSAQQNLIGTAEGFSGSYETVQRVTSSAAASAVSQLAVRFAAGTDELATLVRRDQDLTVEAERLDKSQIAAVSKPPAERNAAVEDQVRKRIDVIKAERDKLQQVFDQKFPNYAALSKPEPVSLKETQARLANNEALIVFDFDVKSYAWIISKSTADWLELPIAAKDLADQIKTLRKPMPVDEDKLEIEPFDVALAYKIYQATFGVLADKIAGKERLSVVTNGALTGLPPQLLVSKDPTGKKLKEVDWLVKSYAITILPSVTSLKVLRGGSATSSAPKPMTAYADPVFSKKAREQAQLHQQFADNRSITASYRGTQLDAADLAESLPPLPGTRKEVETIGKALKASASDIYLGLHATETAVKQAKLDQYKIVYFATHGLVAGEIEEFTKTKAEPALAFTMPNKPTEFDDGLLQASEVAQLKLNADWVVLSACNTAAEDKPGAEALSGLARAFFYAGARSLIVSHWKVNDNTTAQLMAITFQLYNQRPNMSHSEVLQQAMLKLLNEAPDDNAAHPRFWAPFVVVGEPAKLAK